jgi:VWFA-related protein
MRVSVTWCAALVCVLATVPFGGALATARRPQPAAAAGGPPNPGEAPVRIDAVVTDRQGRPILDLQPSDFELFENGASRSFTTVELRSAAAHAAAAPIETEADELRAAGEPGTRVFAFFMDEFHVTAGENADRARDAVAKFVDEQLQPQDLALVMKPLDPVTGLRFTRDRTVLRAALAGFTGRKGDLTPRSAFEEQYIGRAPAAVAAARAQIVTAGLRELTLRFGELQPDRGVVVLLSEGFPRGAAVTRGARGQDLQGVVRASSRFHLSMYTFNPAAAAAADAPDTARETAGATLQWLAAQTGGQAVLEAGDLAAGFGRMAHDLASYYALTYTPAQADGRFHAVEVRTKRKNVEVRARPGYWAALGGEWRALLTAGSTPPVSMRALHRSALVDTWVGLAPDAAGRTRMVVTWEPGATTASPPHIVVVQARAAGGAEIFNGQVAAVQASSGAQADSARFEVPKGRVELDLSILDMTGKVLDVERRDVDVPDLRSQKRGPVLLFPEVLRARTLRDFRTALTNPDAAPSSARVFARGDRLLIRVPAYDSSGVVVHVSARVLNEWGQPMRDIDPAAGGSAIGMTQFVLPLNWLGPGQYLIELAGSNANGTVKERIAFTVRG